MALFLGFMGTHNPRLDEKGRLILPAKFREELATGLVLTRGQERCVYVHPVAEFKKIVDSLGEIPQSDRRGRAYARVMLSGADPQVPDKQGRVSLPKALRDYAGIDRDLTVIGAGTHVEIWDTASWEAYLAENEGDFALLDA